MENVQKDRKIAELEKELEIYKNLYREAQAELETYRKKNARNAGRKKQDDTWMARYLEFLGYYSEGKNMLEIMESMHISRATYYRFLKLIKEDETYL